MSGNNIIQKQIVEVDMNLPGTSAFQSQAMTTKWCNEVLIPAINRKLEKYSLINDVIRMDNIIIDTIDNLDSLTESLAERIATEIEILIKNKVGQTVSNNHTSIVSKQRTTVEAFIFFLQNAYLPWWSNIRSVSELGETTAMSLTNNELLLLKELIADISIRKRLVTSISQGVTKTVISLIFKIERHEIEAWMEKIRILSLMIENNDLQFQFLIWAKQEYIKNLLLDLKVVQIVKTLVKQLMYQYKITEEMIKLHLQKHHILINKEVQKIFALIKMQDEKEHEMIIGKELKLSKSNDLRKTEQRVILKKEGIYINNAGLVLLAPFLPRFFENLGIIEEGKFNSRDLALALLQWLTTGNDEYEESDLVLPKILCGMEPEEAIIIIPSLPESFKKEADSLLQSVIEHWGILKNTSVNGLRESFLQREGKLSKYHDDWYLQVEQKPYDMLLEHLPWNISMIRLSWMQRVLRTEWVG
ncbi:MAG: contractile injection system tape measure protein [Flavisolibacter sp.]